jgi:hypothetical protein
MTQGTTKLATTALFLFLLTAALMPSVSAADFGIEPGSVEIKALDSGGNPDTQAGGHPDRLVLDFNIETTGVGTAARDLLFEFEPGLTGSPLATKTCSRAVFELEACPADTQVGKFFGTFVGGESFDQAVYNLAPASNQLAVLAFHPFWLTELEMKLRPDDFGLNISTEDMPQLPFEKGHIELWGIPADHNGSSERAAFLTTPTECGPMKFVLRTRSWEVGAPWLSEAVESAPFTGCEGLPFEPSLALHLTNPNPDSPTGAKIDLNLVEHNDPDETAGANMKDVRIDLPPGLTLSPAGVEGREPCTDGQFGLRTESEVTCPFHSRVGSVEVSTPQLGESLVGSMFLGQERPGERFRLFVHASARGIDYKALARLVADPRTGRLSAELNGLPQFAVNQISLDFEGGSHALLATPLSCGPATARGRFVPSTGGGAVESSTSVDIGTSCAGLPPFAPITIAGSTDLSAGRSTGFALTLTRQEGEQLPKKYSVTLPPGLSANLTAVDVCPSAAAASGACPAASKVGSAVAEVGTGPNPAKLSGAVYLTAAYEGAPFGLSVVFRAAIGPFDLGTLNVQVTLRIDPHTGQVTLGHLLPEVFEGVPVRFRMLGLDFPRGGFLVNPTSCEPEQLTATVISVDGRAAASSVPFNVGGCDSLGFRPKFSAALNQRGRHATRPELSFAVNMTKRDANLKRFKVKFPRVLKFHNSAVQEVCPRGDALEERCRAGSRVGTGTAFSPLIRGPLRGPVYLVQPKGKRDFPDLWTNVEGMGVNLQLRSESVGRGGRLDTELVDIPDLPLSSFTMRVSGGSGKDSLFSLGRDACGSRGSLATPVELEGHDGAYRTMTVQLKAGCSKSSSKKRNGRKRAHNRKR